MRGVGQGKIYWWAETDVKRIVDRLSSSHVNWASYGQNPFAQAWYRNTIAYYSTILNANHWESALGYVGEQGELIKMCVPQARSLVRQMVTLTTKQRLNFTVIAETRDSDTTEDLKVAHAVVEELVKEQQLDSKAELALEHACVFGMGFLKCTWRTDKGTPYAANRTQNDDGTSTLTHEYDGEIEISVPTILEMNWDARIHDWKDLNWVECRTVKNRYDLIAQHPELEQEIRQIPAIQWYDRNFATQSNEIVNQDDLVYVFEAYHKPTPAMPEGRMVVYSDDHAVFYDGINPYGCLPIVAIKPEPVHQTGYGYPILSNLLPAQEMFDHCISAISTNQSALAVQSILCPRGAEINPQEIGGLNFIWYTPQNAEGGGKPEAMQLTASAPETFKFAQFLDGYMTSISGLNSTIRGAPPPGLTSGTAIATMSANALEFLNSMSKALDLGLEGIIYMSVAFTGKFGVIPRRIAIIGKNNKASMKTYTGDNLSIMKKIKINRSNPLMATLAGRSDVAEKLLQTGLIKDVQQYFSILDGAPTEVLFENELSENDLMQSENEALMEGHEVLSLITDDHPAHIHKHGMLLNDPMVRASGKMTQVVLDHIMKHRELAQQVPPDLAAMIRTGKMPQGGLPPPGGPMGPGAGMPPPPPQLGPANLPGPPQGGMPALNQPGPKMGRIAPDNLGRGA